MTSDSKLAPINVIWVINMPLGKEMSSSVISFFSLISVATTNYYGPAILEDNL